MKKSDQLKLERTAKVKAQSAIFTIAETENREPTEAENATFDGLQLAITALDAAIVRAETFEDNELMISAARAIDLGGTGIGNGEGKEKQKIAKRFSITKAIRSTLPGAKLDGVEKEVNDLGVIENRNAKVSFDTDDDASGFSLPISMLRATQQTVSQDSGLFGGNLVQNNAPLMVDAFRPNLFLESLGATFLTGLTGGNVPLVVDNDFAMQFLAEGASVSTQKKTYEGPSLTPKRAAGAVSISNRLLMQSSVDVQSRIMEGLKNGFTQLLESNAINGAGTDAPTGLLNISGVLSSATTTASAATYALICELQGLIETNNASSKSLGYIMHPKLKSVLKQLKKDAGSGFFVYMDQLLDGFKSVSTSFIPVLSSTMYPLIFGDFSQLYIGQWGAINIKANPYSEDLADSIRLTLNTHADVAVAQPKAFAKNNFLTA